MLFDNRQQAGKALARRLKEYNRKNTVVLSLPRGGVPVGFEIAKVLGAPLDVLVARKVSPPGNPEFGIAAVSESGVRVIDENTVDFLGISPEELEELIYAEFAQVRLRIQKYRAGKNLPKLRGKTVVFVDDGLATGVTAGAAIASVKLLSPKKIIFAVPVCSADTAGNLKGEVDELLCLHAPIDFIAVGRWYLDFKQTSDHEVIDLLNNSKRLVRVEKVEESPHYPRAV